MLYSLLPLKEMYNEQHKLIRLRNELQDKEMEMWNLKYCVAANPTVSEK